MHDSFRNDYKHKYIGDKSPFGPFVFLNYLPYTEVCLVYPPAVWYPISLHLQHNSIILSSSHNCTHVTGILVTVCGRTRHCIGVQQVTDFHLLYRCGEQHCCRTSLRSRNFVKRCTPISVHCSYSLTFRCRPSYPLLIVSAPTAYNSHS